MFRFIHNLVREGRVAHFLLVDILTEIHKMKSALDELRQAVEQQTTVVDSVATLIQQMATQIRDNADNPTEIRRLADQLEKNNQKLAEASVANTDSEEETNPEA
jgi:methyl-accepting chemotaxis protein